MELSMQSLTQSAKGPPVPSAAAPEQGALPYHAESHEKLHGPIDRIYAHLDDHARLAAHMNKRSWRMGWSRMKLHVDDAAGRAAGSQIRLDGRVLGVALSLVEEITERTPPTRKVWATVGTPRLLVIGPYRMGFTLTPAGNDVLDGRPDDVTVSVFIDYALPDRGIPWLLGRIFGHKYARWCTGRMVTDAYAAFAPATAT